MCEGLFARRIREVLKDTETGWGSVILEANISHEFFFPPQRLLEIIEEAKSDWPLNPDYAWALKKYVEQVEAKAKERGGQPKVHEEKTILKLYDWFMRWFVNGEVKEK